MVQNFRTIQFCDCRTVQYGCHEDATGINLGMGGQDRTVRIFNMSPVKTLFIGDGRRHRDWTRYHERGAVRSNFLASC
jgi:hypothetical protein